MDKSVGQLQGEMGAYAAARSLGFNGNWREFNAMRSEVTALGDFANADAVNKIADNYGISSGQLMQMSAQFQQSKHASEVTWLSNQLGGPVSAGTEAGNVVATETGGKIQGIYAGGGYGNYQQLTSNDVQEECPQSAGSRCSGSDGWQGCSSTQERSGDVPEWSLDRTWFCRDAEGDGGAEHQFHDC